MTRTMMSNRRYMPGEDGLPISDKTTPIRIRRVDVVQEIVVFGHRDPRGPDNNVYLWVDKDDQLHIRILKAERCYKFKEMVDTPTYVEIIQS